MKLTDKILSVLAWMICIIILVAGLTTTGISKILMLIVAVLVCPLFRKKVKLSRKVWIPAVAVLFIAGTALMPKQSVAPDDGANSAAISSPEEDASKRMLPPTVGPAASDAEADPEEDKSAPAAGVSSSAESDPDASEGEPASAPSNSPSESGAGESTPASASNDSPSESGAGGNAPAPASNDSPSESGAGESTPTSAPADSPNKSGTGESTPAPVASSDNPNESGASGNTPASEVSDGNSGGGNGNNFNTYNNQEQKNTSANYVLNTSTMKFHRPSCRDVPKIAPENYATSDKSRDELVAAGYKSCGHCDS